MPTNFSLKIVSQPVTVNNSSSQSEIDRLEQLSTAASQLDRDIQALEREAVRLRVDVQKFVDKKNMLQVLHHISQQ